MKISRRETWMGLVAVLALVAGCKGEGGSSPAGSAAPAAADAITLNGAGATFPYPLYSKWMSEYNKSHPDVRINYQSIGSGGGIRQITAGTVDFGATDAPMTTDEEQKSPGKLHHIPTTLGAVVVSYNVPELGAPLKLTRDALAGVFLGAIKKWNDPKLTAENPGVKLPDKDIAVVYRSDGSGTTAVFTEYLATVSPEFKDKVGAGKSVKWPVGLGSKGNEGVTGQVKTTPGSIVKTPAAVNTPQSQPSAPRLMVRVTEMGFVLTLVNVLASTSSVHEKRKQKNAATPIPGRIRGRKILMKNLPKLYPSIRAVSSSSFGIPDMKPSRIQIARGRLKRQWARATAIGVSKRPMLP